MRNRIFFKPIFCLILLSLLAESAAVLSPAVPEVRFSAKPDHVVLFIIDALSYKVWDKLTLPNLEHKAAEGVLVREVYLPPAGHPRVGSYAELHTCSIPNPILMAGTVFIDRKTRYLNQQFFPDRVTAFCANAIDYQSLNNGYHYSYLKDGDDREVVEMASLFLKMGRPAFVHIHLQDVGSGGEQAMMAETDPWKNDIWHPESPYVSSLKKADGLLEEFIGAVRGVGILEKTAFVIVGDHGQADTGWHPLEIPESSVTTMVLWGAGIKTGVRLDYAELIDVAPTICALMAVDPPPTAIGRVLAGALTSAPEKARGDKPTFLIRTMNEQFRAFRQAEREVAYLLEKTRSADQGKLFTRLNGIKEDFYDIHRFSEWPRFHSLEELVENNETALKLLLEFRRLVLDQSGSSGDSEVKRAVGRPVASQRKLSTMHPFFIAPISAAEGLVKPDHQSRAFLMNPPFRCSGALTPALTCQILSN